MLLSFMLFKRMAEVIDFDSIVRVGIEKNWNYVLNNINILETSSFAFSFFLQWLEKFPNKTFAFNFPPLIILRAFLF
jgi:hypothetical protein